MNWAKKILKFISKLKVCKEWWTNENQVTSVYVMKYFGFIILTRSVHTGWNFKAPCTSNESHTIMPWYCEYQQMERPYRPIWYIAGYCSSKENNKNNPWQCPVDSSGRMINLSFSKGTCKLDWETLSFLSMSVFQCVKAHKNIFFVKSFKYSFYALTAYKEIRFLEL